MTGNKSFLTDYQEINGGFVAFRGSPKGGKITRKDKIKIGKLDFEDVYFVKELKFNLFSVSQMYDKKNNVLFSETECLVLSPDFKLLDESQVLLKVPRQNNMYSFDLKNVVPSGGLTCLFTKATIDESNLWHKSLGHIKFKTMNKLMRGNLVRGLTSKLFENDQTCVACQKGKQHKASCKTKTMSSICKPLQLLHIDLFGLVSMKSINKKSYCLVVTDDFSRFSWVFFLATKDETSRILKTFITGIENKTYHKVKTIRCDNGTEFKNRIMNEFCEMKGIRREFSIAKTPQQNGVSKRKNRTLIEAARTMLADSKLPTTFWAKAVNTTCYIQNRVLVIKPHNKTPYELFLGRKYALSFMRPFGCHVRILNTLDHLGTGPNWMFDIDTLTMYMNYQPVFAGNQTNGNACTKANIDEEQGGMKIGLEDEVANDAGKKNGVLDPEKEDDKSGQGETTNTNSTNRLNIVSSSINIVSSSFTTMDPGRERDQRNEFESVFGQDKDVNGNNIYMMFTPVNAAGSSYNNLGGSIPVNAATLPNVDLPTDPLMPDLEDIGIFSYAYDDEDEDVASTQTKRMTKIFEEHAMRLVDLHKGKHAIGTKYVYRNKKDERGIVVRNKARLVAQGYTQEEGIDYDDVFAPVARIEAIKLFLAYALFMGFIVYQMDVKSAFLYGTIEKEVYVCQPPGFEDLQFPDKVYKVYVDGIIFESTKKSLCVEFEQMMHKRFQISSMGKLTFFLWLQVKQKNDGIFISQDKFQVTPKVSHLHAVKRIFRYLKGQPKLGLWYPRDSPFDLEAFFDSDYAGASLDRKSTTRAADDEIQVSTVGLTYYWFALTKNPTIYVSLIEKFWQTATVRIVDNGEQEITVTVDGKEFTITKASVGRHLQLADVEAEEGEGSGHPSEHQPPPSNAQLTYEEQIPLPHTSVPIPNVADEAVFKEWDDRVGIGAGGSPRVNTLRSDEGDLRHTKKVYGAAYTKLIKKVKKLEKIVKSNQARRRAKIVVSDDEEDLEDSSKQGRMIEEIDQDARVTLVTPTHSQEDQPKDQLGVFSAAKVLADATKNVHTYTRRRMAVSTSSGGVSTASRLFSTAEESVSTAGASMPVSTAGMVQEVNINIPSPDVVKDKGKGIMTESEPEQTKTKLQQRQERAGYEAAVRLQEQLDEEERHRIARVHEEASSFNIKEWEDIQAIIEADEELAQRIQAEEREKYSEAEKARLLVELINQRKRYFAQQRAEERRNKPLTQAQ
ncbi:putative ribonuclease H-like domain-containing protein [Tanacetum coccineum]